MYPSLGYLSRQVFLAPHSADNDNVELLEEEQEQEDDTAAALSQAPKTLTCTQSVVFSPTFRVPVFYFNIHDPSTFTQGRVGLHPKLTPS
jgi:ubiquitin-like-conjugating enzyme ATG10